jgi:hypothetical protein
MSEFTEDEQIHIKNLLLPKNFDEIATKYDPQGKSLKDFYEYMLDNEIKDLKRKAEEPAKKNKKRKTMRKTPEKPSENTPEFDLLDEEYNGYVGGKSKKSKKSKKSRKNRA